MPKVWQLLESIPGPAAVPAVWRASLENDFDAFRESFLRQLPKPARSYPCPRECGCPHEIVKHRDGKIIAVCRCEPCHCDDIPLRDSDIVVLELNWPALGRAAAVALGLTAREADIGVRGALQIAVSGSDALPVVLVIQNDRASFRQTVDALVARLRDRFMVIAPTADYMDASVQQILSNANARFVALDVSVRISDTGTLMPSEAPGGSGVSKGKYGWEGLRIGEIFEPRTMLWNGKTFPIEEPPVCYKGYDLDNVSLEDYFPDLRDDWDRYIKDVPHDEIVNLRILQLVSCEKTLSIHLMLKDSVAVYPDRLESSGETDGWHPGGVIEVADTQYSVKGIRVEPTDPTIKAKIEASRRARKPAVSPPNITTAAVALSAEKREGAQGHPKSDISVLDLKKHIDHRFDTLGREFLDIQNENASLKQDLAQVLASIARQVTPEFFQWMFVILGTGSVNAAAHRLGIPGSTFSDRVNEYVKRGGVYKTLHSMLGVRRKGAGRKQIERFNELFDEHQGQQAVAEPGVLRELLDGIEDLNGENWKSMRDELIEIARRELPER